MYSDQNKICSHDTGFYSQECFPIYLRNKTLDLIHTELNHFSVFLLLNSSKFKLSNGLGTILY